MAKYEAILRTLLNTIAAEQQYKDPKISTAAVDTAGANYTTKLFQATISSKGKKDLKLFGKVASLGDKIRNQYRITLFETEIMFYTHLMNIFEGIQEKHSIPLEHKLVFSKFYGHSDKKLEETIVLEDLTARGFSCYSRFESIDWAYASKAVEEMAKLHALSMALSKENPEEFELLMNKYRYNPTEDVEGAKKYWNNVFNSAMEAATEENKKSLQNYYEGIETEVIFTKMRRTMRRPTLVHSAFRPSNLMHKIHDDGSVDLIPVDYQTVQAGCPVFDLLFFLMTGSDRAFRKQYQEQLIDHYYNYLRGCMERLKLNPDEQYSRDDLEYEWKEMLPIALSMAIYSLPYVTVEEKDAPVVDQDTDSNGFTIKKTSPLYADRINEVIEDFRKLGILN